jgi:putative PIN family toxin of toxin-antitoxin system
MKVVLDTNVLIAAFITRGSSSDLLEHCIRQHEIVTSEFILDEFRQHLIHKFNFSVTEVGEAIELLRIKVKVVTPVTLESPVCRDPDDNVILGTAVAGDVACIVTGDKDLLMLERFGSVDIVSPAEFSAYEAAKQN